MKVVRVVVCVFAMLALPVIARAQTAADSAGVLLGVADQLESEGEVQLARAILDLITRRYANTPAAEIATRRLEVQRASRVEQSGRTELLVFGTAYGLFLGAAIPAALESNDPAAYGIGLILGGPTGFLASRMYAGSRSLTEGQARAITFGGTWGMWQGFGWSQVLDLGENEYCDEFGGCYSSDQEAQAIFTSMIVGSLTGIGVGTALSQKNITDGTATTVSFGSLWGSWYGGGIAAMLDIQDDDLLRAILVGGNLGIVGAALGAPKWNFSPQRARLISISGVAGLLGGLGLLMIIQPDGNDAIAVPLATSTLGLGLGAHWTRNMEPDRLGFLRGLEAPSVQPRIIERVRNGRLERVPAIGVTLIQARF
jgi:hypothetical protein